MTLRHLVLFSPNREFVYKPQNSLLIPPLYEVGRGSGGGDDPPTKQLFDSVAIIGMQ
jgi:hypothetical protein